jgi:hypothetical protein
VKKTSRARDFVLSITPEERAFGFTLREVRTAMFVVAATLPDGVVVMKMRGPTGIEYDVCDDNLEPVCVLGRTLDELSS